MALSNRPALPDPNEDRGRRVSAVALAQPSQLAPEEFWADAADDATPHGIHLLRFAAILFKWRWAVGAAVVLALIGGVTATLLTTPLYQATSELRIDREAPKVLDIAGGDPSTAADSRGSEFYQTEYGVLRSRLIIEKTVDSLNLADNAQFFGAAARKNSAFFSSSPVAREGRRNAAIGRIMGNLQIQPVPLSGLVRITYQDTSPVIASQVANAVGDSFIQANLEQRYEASSYARDFLQKELDKARVRLEQSERAVVDYAIQQQIINIKTGSTGDSTGGSTATESLTATNLGGLNAALGQAETSRILAEQHWKQAQADSGADLPEVIANPSVQAVRQAKAGLEAEYQQKLGVFKPEYPEMVQLKTRIDTLDGQIKAEIEAVKLSIKSQYLVAQHQEQSLTDEVNKLKLSFLDLSGRSIQYATLQRDADTNRALYEALLQRYKDIGVAGGVGTNNVSFVDHAQTPGGPFKPQPAHNMMMALVAGLALGGLLAFGLEQLDETLKRPEEVEEKLGVPLLGVIPTVSKGIKPPEALADPRSAISEAYFSLRTALQFSTASGPPSTLLVTSAKPSEGKSTTALALARGFARLGSRTLLIDSDLRNPSLHKTLGTSNLGGLSNLLTGAGRLEDFVQSTAIPNLFFIPCGPLPPVPAELLGGAHVREVLAAALEQFDQVIIDGPPVMGLADAPLLAAATAGSILVIEAGSTRRSLARASLARLRTGSSRVLGAVLTKFSANQGGYGYGYGYGYGSDDAYRYGGEIAKEMSGGVIHRLGWLLNRGSKR